MTESNASKGRIFVGDLSGNRIFSVKADGTGMKVIVTQCWHPDGIAVDTAEGYIYWTDMGDVLKRDGSIMRADLDGKNITTILPRGEAFNPKQLILDRTNQRLYWAEREGMRVMRSSVDGTKREVLYQSGEGDSDRKDARNWCVGVGLDLVDGFIYWSQKGGQDSGQGRIFRMQLEIPKGQTAVKRSDVECLFDDLPEPIDIEIDSVNRRIYWTDRGDPPRGNSLSRAYLDIALGEKREQEIIVDHLMEGIGVALDIKNDRVFLTDMSGGIYCARLDGSEKKMLLWGQGNLGGVAYGEIDL